MRIRRHPPSRADGPGCGRPAVRHANSAAAAARASMPSCSYRWAVERPMTLSVASWGQWGAVDEPGRTSTVRRQQPSARRRPRVPPLQRSAASSRDPEQHGLHGDQEHGGVADRSDTAGPRLGSDDPDEPSLLPGSRAPPGHLATVSVSSSRCQAPATGEAQWGSLGSVASPIGLARPGRPSTGGVEKGRRSARALERMAPEPRMYQ